MAFPSFVLALNTEEGKSKLTDFLGLAHSTFVVRVINNQMSEAQILEGDFVFVNPTLPPKDGCIVLANKAHEEIILRRYVVTPYSPYLTCDDRECEDIELSTETQVEILGVVTGFMHPMDLME